MSGFGPVLYRSYEEFERENIRPLHKIGFSLDDLEEEATFKPGREDHGEQNDELNFG